MPSKHRAWIQHSSFHDEDQDLKAQEHDPDQDPIIQDQDQDRESE